MRAAGPGQVIARADRVLKELLGVVAALSHNESGKDVIRRVGQLWLRKQVAPVEMRVPDTYFLELGGSQHFRPRADHVYRFPRSIRHLRRMLGARHLRKGVAPVPV